MYYNPPEGQPAHSPTAAKYQENGQDNFSDFVTLVCQEAGGQGGQAPPHPGTSRSPAKVSSYYTPSMYPPPPPMSRPVALIRSGEMGSTSSPPVATSPQDHHLGYDLMPPIISTSETPQGPHIGDGKIQTFGNQRLNNKGSMAKA